MSIIALCDCNNFFVSCERAFNPALEKRPVVVLSNNDGCVVSRSNEAKRLGIKMGQPVFQLKDIINREQVTVLSSNFELYSDMSHRVMATLSTLCPHIEFYSIDEAFLDCSDLPVAELENWGRHVMATIKRHTGIPVTVGFGATKTLAKVATHWIKKGKTIADTLDLVTLENSSFLLQQTPIEDVWGIGRQYSKMLRGHCIYTAWDFRNLPLAWVRKKMSVVGAKIAEELRGTACLTCEEAPMPRKSLTVSRTFSSPTTDFSSIREATASFVAACAEKLRTHKLTTRGLSIFLYVHQPPLRPYALETMTLLPEATSLTPVLIKHALDLLEKIFQKGHLYRKAGVTFFDLHTEGHQQSALFASPSSPFSLPLMHAIDRLNHHYGRHTLIFGATGLRKTWMPRRAHCSPRYTTRWEEIPVVKAGVGIGCHSGFLNVILTSLLSSDENQHPHEIGMDSGSEAGMTLKK